MSAVKTLAIGSLFLLIFLSCGGIKPCVKEERKENLRMKAEKKFDPWKIEKENPIIIQEKSNQPQEDFSRVILDKYEIGEDKVNNQILYRIQIFASKFPEEAQKLADSLESNFNEPTTIDYEAPYYKVRLGNFTSLAQAESFLRKVRRKGFPQAWVVKTRKEEREENDRD